jgi:hypothetical protein
VEKITCHKYINGNKLPSGTHYRDVKLNAHDEIALIYGILPANIPSKYDFHKAYDPEFIDQF